jgi:protein ImuB
MPFAAIFVPDFPVEALLRTEPERREQAVVLLEGTPPLLRVVACNQRAREAGVQTGMTKLEAVSRFQGFKVSKFQSFETAKQPEEAGTPKDANLATLKPCNFETSALKPCNPETFFRRRCPAAEQAAHAALVDCACAFSPRVEDNPHTPDTVVLDLAGLERLFGPPPRIARELARRASTMGLETNVAVAVNIETAIYAARGFAGITVIAPGEEAERLGTLPIELLLDEAGREEQAPNADLFGTLARWGVRTFRALAALPETAVRQRLGDPGVQLQKLARGRGARPLVPAEPPLRFEEAAELEYPITLLEPLSALLSRMLEQLCMRLAARALATQKVTLRLETGWRLPAGSPTCLTGPKSPTGRPEPRTDNRQLTTDDRPPATVLQLPVPMLDAKVFLKLLQLELQAKPPEAPVSRVLLWAEPVPPRFTQGGLFLPTAPEPEKLEVMLARIHAVVSRRPPAAGHEQPAPAAAADFVGAAEVLNTHRSDAFRVNKFVAPEAVQAVAKGARAEAAPPPPAASEPSRRPAGCCLRRFRPPLPVKVELRDGKPVRLFSPPPDKTRFAGSRRLEGGGLLWAAGPWRESGDWWTPQPWSREVWDVAVRQSTGAAVYRIFRDLLCDEWRVEGSYD